ncbi:hypothetical protein HMPREF9625_00983 [Oribacterium parvum ACB1]|uniref:Uncharacterized protein n=1 Tax=Oribacterium parvum ACB1 TaxID=796943 RepID=G9WNQ0_9FIRM|nr:PspC family transcriptional regulator [Oribacterium parvum]EHL10787.1 hypothetical protein HMPREF9625_00983 [Oribacterium parvum ACB1]EJF11981.1 cell wall-binding repeat protein [Oribacterium parvum ACB8]
MKKGKKKALGTWELRVLEFTEKLILLLLLIWLILIPFSNNARAAESTVIETIKVNFASRFGDQEEIVPPDVTVSDNDVEITDVHYRKDYDYWVPGQKVRVEILLHAKEGKVFSAVINRSKVGVSGANFVEAKLIKGNNLLVKADYIPMMVLGNVSYAAWNGAHSMGIWDKVRFAPSYTVALYGDNKLVQEFKGVKTSFFDFGKYMKDKRKTYYYEVKAAPLTEEQKKYLKEGQYVIATTDEVPEPAGSGPELEPEQSIEDYLSEGNGVEPNSWRYVGRRWYFLDASCRVKKGWLERSGEWFFLNPKSGAMETGLVETGKDKFAYFRDDGVMLSNTWVHYGPDVWYLFGQDGYMINGWWKNSRGDWFYLNPEFKGRMHIGWLKYKEDWYYLDKNGAMLRGFQNINGKTYFFVEDGKMLSNTDVEGRHLGADGAAT